MAALNEDFMYDLFGNYFPKEMMKFLSHKLCDFLTDLTAIANIYNKKPINIINFSLGMIYKTLDEFDFEWKSPEKKAEAINKILEEIEKFNSENETEEVINEDE